jgi:3-oxoacyl-[acyl-carrier protein] reductase
MGEGGRIINVSSTAARQGNPGSVVYAASKAAVESITRVMAVELRDRGIRVTSINPGPVTTDMFHSLSEDVQEYFRSSQPVAKPDDISDVIVFLAGPKSRWVNGGTINTNNGVILD